MQCQEGEKENLLGKIDQNTLNYTRWMLNRYWYLVNLQAANPKNSPRLYFKPTTIFPVPVRWYRTYSPFVENPCHVCQLHNFPSVWQMNFSLFHRHHHHYRSALGRWHYVAAAATGILVATYQPVCSFNFSTVCSTKCQKKTLPPPPAGRQGHWIRKINKAPLATGNIKSEKQVRAHVKPILELKHPLH